MRVRPTSDPHQIVVAFPWRHRGRAQALGRAVAEVLDAVPGADVDAAVSRGRRRGRRGRSRAGSDHDHAEDPGGRRDGHQRQDHDEPDDRPHRPHQRAVVGWSNTDGIYVDGELVEAGDYSGPSGAGRVLAHPQVAAGRHRDGQGRHPPEGDRPDPQRRVRRDQRDRRPPGAARHRHRRPARRGQGRGPADHPQGRLGGAQRRRPAGLRHARRRPRRSRGSSPATPTRRRSARLSPRRWAGHHRDRRLGLGAATRRRRRPARRARRRADDAGRAVPLQRREHAGRRLRRPRDRASPARPSSRGCAPSAPTPSTTPGG